MSSNQSRSKPIAIGNGLLSVMFLALAAASSLDSEWLDAGVWACLGAAMLTLGSEATPWNKIPAWRRLIGSALFVLGVAALLVRLWIDFTT